MLSLHDLDDFMDTDAVPAEPAKTAAKRQEPSTAVPHNPHNDHAHRNDDALKDVLNMHNAADLLSVQDAYLKGVQNLLSALSTARNQDKN
jgi:hypothetical protein